MMMERMTILDPDGSISHRDVSLSAEPNYYELQAALGPVFAEQRNGPAHWEHVSVMLPNGQRGDMFVDETGAQYPALPVNIAATRHYHRASISRGEVAHDGVIPGGDMIYGVAVMFDRRVWF